MVLTPLSIHSTTRSLLRTDISSRLEATLLTIYRPGKTLLTVNLPGSDSQILVARRRFPGAFFIWFSSILAVRWANLLIVTITFCHRFLRRNEAKLLIFRNSPMVLPFFILFP